MENILSVEKEFLPQIQKLWEVNANVEFVERGYAIPKALKRNSLLFIGINPSYDAKYNSGTYDLYIDDPYKYFYCCPVKLFLNDKN